MMRLIDYFRRSQQKKSASVAKDRLQIIVARERTRAGTRDYLPLLHQELVQVIAKYEEIDPERVTVSLDVAGSVEVLELNIQLPEQPRPTEYAREASAAATLHA